jgi:hypothetical protein
MVNLALRSTILVNLDVMVLECLTNFGEAELKMVNLKLPNLC